MNDIDDGLSQQETRKEDVSAAPPLPPPGLRSNPQTKDYLICYHPPCVIFTASPEVVYCLCSFKMLLVCINYSRKSFQCSL